jgi:hypothetical protein
MLRRKRGFNTIEPLMVVAIWVSRCLFRRIVLSSPIVSQRTREREVQ